MSLRKTMVASVAITLVSLVTILFVVTRNNLLENYMQLERLELKEDITRVQNAIRARAESLDTLVRDWASWDDSYEFIETRSAEYIDSNLGEGTYSDADLRMILFADRDGQVVYGRAWSSQSGVLETLPAALAGLPSDGRILQDTPQSSLLGVLTPGEESLVIAARPVLTSENGGPVRGTLIMARDFEGSIVAEVARATSMDIAVQRLDRPAASADLESIRAQLLEDGDGERANVMYRVPDEDTVAGYTLLTDVFGEASHLLRVQTPRTVYARAQDSLMYFLISLIVIGVVLLLLVVYLLDRLVLLPLSRLNRHVTHVAQSGNLSLLYRPPGKGELTQLADNIRTMLDEVRRARTDLERANERLERRVDERTIELVQARDQAVDALRVKDRILANVSHDSRTPLNTIMLRAELMKTGRYGTLTGPQTLALDSIVASVNQLTLFTTNLLYEAQSAAGRIDLHGDFFELESELERIAAIMRPLAERKALSLTLSGYGESSVTLQINRQALHQIVANLVDNAIKFTEQGEIDIRMQLPDESHVAISVSDTGKGIPENLHQRIFDPFWQVDSSVTREANRGVGLGLSIVRLLVERLGGTTSINSDAEGTVFTVTLPRRVE